MLTNDNKIAIFREDFAPLNTFQASVAVVLLARRLVEEIIEEEIRKKVRVVQKVVRSARQALNNEVREVGVRC